MRNEVESNKLTSTKVKAGESQLGKSKEVHKGEPSGLPSRIVWREKQTYVTKPKDHRSDPSEVEVDSSDIDSEDSEEDTSDTSDQQGFEEVKSKKKKKDSESKSSKHT